ncbi:MAG: hypothetical protein J6Y16_00960 [Treponema sp.]|nr:hypothetical protein [Treponema sp.]
MGHFKNFKSVIYCPNHWVINVKEEELEEQFAFYEKYVGIDKVYVEPYRSGKLADREKVLLIKSFFEKHGVEVAGGFTTTSQRGPIAGKEYKGQRLFDTYCYTDKDFRAEIQKNIEFTAGIFDEIILDDFYFTNCTCEDCIKAKGNRSWQEFRLALMKDVSENVIVGPAKKVNPNCKVVIKYPNWMESYAEAGYNPGEQRHIFDGVYTGTETRNVMDQDQNLPRYLSYSLVRWMENLAPGRNGGGWFDAYQCYPMEDFLEQAYLTAFSKARELMIFCWPLVYDHHFVPTLGFQMQKIDRLMSYTGGCLGIAEYHPVNAQGDDHLADYLGMQGIPFEPTPEFPEKAKTIFFTAASTADPSVMEKLEDYVRKGGNAIVTSGFLKLMMGRGIEQMTSIRYRDRHLTATHYQVYSKDSWEEYKTPAYRPITFPLMEHRNNTSWQLLKGMTSEKNFPILIRDCYGKGQMITFVTPDNFSDIQDLPREVLNSIRQIFSRNLDVYIECGKNIGLFLYDNNTFITYAYEYMNEGPQACYVHVKGKAKKIVALNRTRDKEFEPYLTVPENKWTKEPLETVFKITTHPDIFDFWKIEF